VDAAPKTPASTPTAKKPLNVCFMLPSILSASDAQQKMNAAFDRMRITRRNALPPGEITAREFE
jgi:hypothetical protein